MRRVILVSVAQPSSIPGPASADFITIIVETNFRHRQDEKGAARAESPRSVGTQKYRDQSDDHRPYVFLGDDNAENRAIPSSRPPLRSDKPSAIRYRIVS